MKTITSIIMAAAIAFTASAAAFAIGKRAIGASQPELALALSFNKRLSLAEDYSLRAWFNRDKDSLLRAMVNLTF